MIGSIYNNGVQVKPLSACDSERIARIAENKIIEPLESRLRTKIEICNVTELLPSDANESNPKYQQLVGDFLIFHMKILEEINKLSENLESEGYCRQGSRMAYHRFNSIKNDLEKALNNHHNVFLVVRDKNTKEILGSIALSETDMGIPELSNFYLKKELRRTESDDLTGLGKYLLSKMFEHARNMKYKEIFLTSRRRGGFERALYLFCKFGFTEVTNSDELNRFIRPEYQSPRTIAMKVNIS